jgi:hypothetical protein
VAVEMEVCVHRRAMLWLAALLIGCTTTLSTRPTGPTYIEHASLLGAVPSEMARLNVFWPAADKEFAGVPRITIDQNEIGFCKRGGFITVEVPAGVHVLTVDDSRSGVGRCYVRVNATGGSDSFYEVSPRMEHLRAGAPGGIFAMIPVPPITLFGLAAAYAGMAAESSGKECGGPFSIAPVEESAALPKISDLKVSK